jgi:uncharacterized membrane protein YfcA
MFNTLTAIGIGAIAGICSGLFGIGGGIVIVPLLIFVLGYQQQNATATSLAALLLPVGALGVWEYYKAGKLSPEHFKVGLLIALGLFIGAYIGSKIAINLPETLLRRMFACFLVVIAMRLWFWVK